MSDLCLWSMNPVPGYLVDRSCSINSKLGATIVEDPQQFHPRSKMSTAMYVIRRYPCLSSLHDSLRAATVTRSIAFTRTSPSPSQNSSNNMNPVVETYAFHSSPVSAAAASTAVLVAGHAAPSSQYHALRDLSFPEGRSFSTSGGRERHPLLGISRRRKRTCEGAGRRRAFGGQSVVPWELALFLVEEVMACPVLSCAVGCDAVLR